MNDEQNDSDRKWKFWTDVRVHAFSFTYSLPLFSRYLLRASRRGSTSFLRSNAYNLVSRETGLAQHTAIDGDDPRAI